jgi:glyoxylase-like metal-dependent hydrolase (beta-lactamase superfamily II)
LVAATCAVVLGALCGNAAAQNAPSMEPVEVAPGVFAFITGNTTDELVDGNTTIVIGTKAVLVVDAPSVRLSREHLRWLRRRTSLPVKYVVNTHWHRDHVFGNQVWVQAYPGVEILATSYTKQVSDVRNPAVVHRLHERLHPSPLRDSLLEPYKRRIATGKNEDGTAATAHEVQRARDALAYFARDSGYWADTRYVGPTTTFDTELRLELGDREVWLRREEGHTGGDAVAYLPGEGVLIAGDLVIAPVPYGINSHFRAWTKALRRLEATERVKAIVPGHGPVLGSWDYVRSERELIDTLLAQVETGVRAALSLTEVRARVDLSRFGQQLARSDPGRQWAFKNYFVDPGVERAYAEVRGDW